MTYAMHSATESFFSKRSNLLSSFALLYHATTNSANFSKKDLLSVIQHSSGRLYNSHKQETLKHQA